MVNMIHEIEKSHDEGRSLEQNFPHEMDCTDDMADGKTAQKTEKKHEIKLPNVFRRGKVFPLSA
jgi:hypothetical protein